MKIAPTSTRPSGFCECGCGEPTPLAIKTQASRGWVKGCPIRFVPGHQARTQHAGIAWDDQTGCAVWSGRTNRDGYGVLTITGKSVLVHRLIWEHLHGQVPHGLVIDHLCHNRACLNVAHLQPVTQTENVRRGMLARLDRETIAKIRLMVSDGRTTDAEIAETFGISISHAGNIRRGARWAS